MVGIILGAGYSKRMGTNKLLLPFRGKRVIEVIIEEAINSRLEEIYLVCRENKIKEIAGSYPITIITNPRAEEGQSTSIVAAMEKIGDRSNSYMFLMGDQPLVDQRLIDDMVNFFYHFNPSILIPSYQGQRGTPVVFSSKWHWALRDLKGDQGGRQIIKAYENEVLEYIVDRQWIGKDIDRIEDYHWLLKDEG